MKFGHPFLNWNISDNFNSRIYFISGKKNIEENKTTSSFINGELDLTEQQIRRLHKRFGHASVSKLGNLLDRAGYNNFKHHLNNIVQHCELCQKYGSAPRRFKFSLQNDDCCFNQTIFVDIFLLIVNLRFT